MTDSLPVPQWTTLPPPRPPQPASRRWLKLMAPFGIAVVLWLVGLHELAVIVLVVAAVLTVLTTMSTTIRSWVDRAAAWIADLAGRFLTFVLLGLVQLLVFTPASLFNRLTRSDPMDPLAGLEPTSRWLAREGIGRDLPHRIYGDERYRRVVRGTTAPALSPRWIRGIVGGLTLLVAADLVVGTLLQRLDEDGTGGVADGVPAGFDPAGQEALAGQDGARELMDQLGEVGLGRRDPFLGWEFGDEPVIETDLLTITDGVRRTRASELAGPALEVWFFGGSTMYGSGQSDLATIPSVLVARLDDAGIAVNATNLGRPAYAQWQQVQLLEEELAAGRRPPPDLVVFYDGFNDLTLQTNRGVHSEPTHLLFGVPSTPAAESATVAETVRTWWGDHSAVALAVDRVGGLFDDEPSIQLSDNDAVPIDTIDPEAAADAAIQIHRRGVEHVEALGVAYGFDTLFFWQPFLYTREPWTPAETELVGLPGYDTDVWFPLTERARASLTEPIVDLSDVLDDEPTSLYWDFVHTNERGAAIVADAMVPHLLEALES